MKPQAAHDLWHKRITPRTKTFAKPGSGR